MLKFSHYLRKPLRLNILFLELTKLYQCNGTIQRLGMHSVQRRRLRADLITVFKIFTGPLGVNPNPFFLPHNLHDLRRHAYKVLHGKSHLRRRGSAFAVRVVKYWNKLSASVTEPFINIFKKKLKKCRHRSFPVDPIAWTLTSSILLPFPPAIVLPIKRHQFCVTQLPVLTMWFLQARCGLLFTIIDHYHIRRELIVMHLNRSLGGSDFRTRAKLSQLSLRLVPSHRKTEIFKPNVSYETLAIKYN